MSDAAALLAAIRAAPADDAPRLVYADWLDEHGQPERAALLREHCRAYRLPAGHPDRNQFRLAGLVAAVQAGGGLPDGVVVPAWADGRDLVVHEPYGSTLGRWTVRRGLI